MRTKFIIFLSLICFMANSQTTINIYNYNDSDQVVVNPKDTIIIYDTTFVSNNDTIYKITSQKDTIIVAYKDTTASNSISFTTNIPFNKKFTRIAGKKLIENIEFTIDTLNSADQNTSIVELIGDWHHSPKFTNFRKYPTSDDYSVVDGFRNKIKFFNDNWNYYYNITVVDTVDISSQTKQYLNYLYSEGKILTNSDKYSLNRFINSVWNKVDRGRSTFHLLNWGNYNFCKYDLFNQYDYRYSQVGTPIYDNIGVQFDGVSSAFRTGYIPSQKSINNKSAIIIYNQDNIVNGNWNLGATNAGSTVMYSLNIRHSTADIRSFQYDGTNGLLATANYDGYGSICGARVGISHYLVKNGTILNSNATSISSNVTSIPVEMTVGCANSNGTLSLFRKNKISAYGILTPNSISDIQNITSALEVFMRSVGASPYYNASHEDMRNGNYICVGNSLTYGYQVTATQNYPYQLNQLLFNGTNVVNRGVNSQTTAQMITEGLRTDSLYNASKSTNVLIVWEGTNSIYFGETPQQAYNDLVFYCQDRKSKGFKVIVLTTLPRGQVKANGDSISVYNSELDVYNELVTSNYNSFSDYCIDVRLNPKLTDYNNTTYFQTDKIHLNASGYYEIANMVFNACKNF